MKLLFLIENFSPFIDASANVLKNLLTSSPFNNHEIHVLSIGDGEHTFGNIVNHTINFKYSFLDKAKFKIFNKKYFKNKRFAKIFSVKALELCEKYRIDNIICVMGNCNFLLCEFPKQYIISYIYYDPFIGNYFYQKSRIDKLKSIERKSLLRAKHVFMLEEYLKIYKDNYGSLVDKFIPFYVTNFHDSKANVTQKTNLLLHTGGFFKGLRDPSLFFRFLNALHDSGISVKAVSLGKLPKNLASLGLPPNLSIVDRKYGNEYSAFLDEANVFVVVDNCVECIQIPSKVFEYIGYNKKIVLFTSGETNTFELLRNNKNVFAIVEDFNDNDIKSFCEFMKLPSFNERINYSKYESEYVARQLLDCLCDGK